MVLEYQERAMWLRLRMRRNGQDIDSIHTGID